jgi:hypothetical protein
MVRFWPSFYVVPTVFDIVDIMTDEQIPTQAAVSEKTKRANLNVVCQFIQQKLGIDPKDRWSPEGFITVCLKLLGNCHSFQESIKVLFRGVNFSGTAISFQFMLKVSWLKILEVLTV